MIPRPNCLPLACVIVVTLLDAAESRSAGMPAIVPQPARLVAAEGRFVLNEKTMVVTTPGAEAEARHLTKALRTPTGLRLRLTKKPPAAGFLHFQLEPTLATRLGKEGYALSIAPQRVSLRAAEPAGLFYAGITFRQLLPPETFGSERGRARSFEVPCLQIQDSPRFPWRGLLLDVGRHFFPLEFLKRLVDLAALHKLNSLQLHLTDDQGWRIEIKKYPRLTQIGSVRRESPRRGAPDRGDGQPYGPFFYTQAQLRDLVAYAQARHVTIVPEIEMPGHCLAALTAYPELSCTGGPFQVRTRWGVEPDILCAGNDRAIAFAQDVLAEVMAVFPSRFIHIGGDEAPRDRWKSCAKCQARIRTEGLKNEPQLQTWFNRRIEEFLVQHGRRLIGWDEILEGGLTPGAAVMSWRGTAGGVAAAEAGHDVVMSPTSHCYFDYSQSKDPGEPESIGGLVPLRTVYEFEPMPASLPEARKRHILGAQGNVWTEFIWLPREVEYFAFPRAAALAEVVWTPRANLDYRGFFERLAVHLKRLDALKVNYRQPKAQDRADNR